MGNKALQNRDEDKHESYGMVMINRTNSSGTQLFGSIARHNSFITISIKEGSVSRNLSGDWYHDGAELIEIGMAHTQFAEAITSPGIGPGVPCTIMRFNGKGMKPCPAPEPIISKFANDLKETTVETVANLRSLRQQLAQSLLPGEKPLNKTQQKELLEKIDRALMDITDSIPFIEKQFHEEMEDQTNKFLGELDAAMNDKVHRLGLQALAEKQVQESLPEFPQAQLPEGDKK